MQCAPYAYVGLALGHNLDYGINKEQDGGEKNETTPGRRDRPESREFTPSMEGSYAKSSYLNSNGPINIPEMKPINSSQKIHHIRSDGMYPLFDTLSA